MSRNDQGSPHTCVDGGVQSVASALDVLDCFATDSELGITEIARRIGVAKSTAHRLVTTLTSRGLLERSADQRRYRLGMHTFALGQLALERNTIRSRALPTMQQLQRMTGATVHLSVWEGAEVVYLERLLGRNCAELMSVGRRFPSHCTSSGKVMAAYSPSFEHARTVAGFPRFTAASIHDTREYLSALDRVRVQNYATNVEEAVDGYSSVAAPILDHNRTARAAISIAAPAAVLATNLGATARLVQGAAKQLSAALCL